MRAMIFAALTLVATTAFAGSFPSIQEFVEYTKKEMRGVPDVKVPLGKAINTSKLSKKGEVELLLMKNSIYAQAGYTFRAPFLKDYFETRAWYHGVRYDRSKLKAVDRENAHAISRALAKVRKANGGGEGDDGYGAYDGYDGYGYGEK